MGNTIDALAEPITSKHTERGSIAPQQQYHDRYMPASSTNVDSSSSSNNNNRSTKNVCTASSSDSGQFRIQYAAASMQGWRPSMEDAHTLAPCLTIPATPHRRGESCIKRTTVLRDHAVFAVFDGHGGGFTSEYAGTHLLRVLTAREEWGQYLNTLNERSRADVPGIELLRAALTGTFLDLDAELYAIHSQRVSEQDTEEQKTERANKAHAAEARRNSATGGTMSPESRNGESTLRRAITNTGQRSRSRSPSKYEDGTPNPIRLDRSGSTAVLVLLTPTHIICANSGDSRAILSRGRRALPLSFDHKPSNPAEKTRIITAGGMVKTRRVDGDLAVSRGLGDFRFKGNPALQPENQKVTAKPEFVVSPRDYDRDEFLVLACDGIWDVVSNENCMNIVQGLLDEGESDMGMVCEDVLDICLQKDSKDNMTVLIVALSACRMHRAASPVRLGNAAAATAGAKNGVGVLQQPDNSLVRERREERKLQQKQKLISAQAKNVAQSAVSGVLLNATQTMGRRKKSSNRREVSQRGMALSSGAGLLQGITTEIVQ